MLDNGDSFLGLVIGGVGGELAGEGIEQANKVLGNPLGVEFVEQAFKKKFTSNFISGGIAEVAFAIPGFIEINTDPRLTFGQKLTQDIVAGTQVFASIGAGAAVGAALELPAVAAILGPFGGPVVFVGGVAAGIIVDITFENFVKPGISSFAVSLPNGRDPFRVIRRPKSRVQSGG